MSIKTACLPSVFVPFLIVNGVKLLAIKGSWVKGWLKYVTARFFSTVRRRNAAPCALRHRQQLLNRESSVAKLKEKMRLTALVTAVVLGLVVQSGGLSNPVGHAGGAEEATGRALSVPPIRVQVLQAQCDEGAQFVVTPLTPPAAMELNWHHTRWGAVAEGWYGYLSPSFYAVNCQLYPVSVWRDA